MNKLSTLSQRKHYYFLSFILVLTLFSCNQNKPYTIYLAGDSTMAEKELDKRPETGWGEHLHDFLSKNVTVANHAKNGRSSKSFVAEGRWDSIMSLLKPGDYVFIQFGHNDEKTRKDKYSSPEDFYSNMCHFVDDVRSKKATPILLTPVMRRRFDENGKFFDTHGDYPVMTRKAAADKEVSLIDMHQLSEKLLIEYGEEKSKELFLIAEPGVWNNYPDGRDDNTHFNDKGAYEMAHLAIEAIEKSDIAIKKDIINQ
nr:rhamnogalacturonan acetylesterase [uncultured Carboxylicivirga sp.]